MSQASQTFSIRHASAGRITDEHLDHITTVAVMAEEGISLSESDAALLRLTVPGLLRELRQRRAAMDLISDCTNLDNVHFLPCTTGD